MAIACTPQQPLPNPSNPLSAQVACTNSSECTGGKVCHLAIGAGTCAAPCTTDSYCDGIESGFICQAAAGNVCAPSCLQKIDGLDVCTTLNASLSCGADGLHCVSSPVADAAYIRVLNAFDADTPQDVFLNQNPLTTIPIPQGQLDPEGYFSVPPDSYDLSVGESSTFDPNDFTFPVTVNAGAHYTAVVFDISGAPQNIWLADDAPYIPAGQVSIRFTSVCQPLTALDLRMTPTGGARQTLIGGVGEQDNRAPVNVAPGDVTLAIGEPADIDFMNVIGLTLLPDHLYSVVASCGGGMALPQASVVSLDGAAAAMYSVGVRVIDASQSDGFSLFVDGSPFLATNGHGTVSPSGRNYQPLPPGPTHTLQMMLDGAPSGASQDITTDTTSATSPLAFNIVCQGLQADGSVSCDPAVSEATPQASIRLLNYAPYTYFFAPVPSGATAPAPLDATFQIGSADTDPQVLVMGNSDGGEIPLDTSKDQISVSFAGPPTSLNPAVTLPTLPITLLPGYRYYAMAAGFDVAWAQEPAAGTLPQTTLSFVLTGPSRSTPVLSAVATPLPSP